MKNMGKFRASTAFENYIISEVESECAARYAGGGDILQKIAFCRNISRHPGKERVDSFRVFSSCAGIDAVCSDFAKNLNEYIRRKTEEAERCGGRITDIFPSMTEDPHCLARDTRADIVFSAAADVCAKVVKAWETPLKNRQKKNNGRNR